MPLQLGPARPRCIRLITCRTIRLPIIVIPERNCIRRIRYQGILTRLQSIIRRFRHRRTVRWLARPFNGPSSGATTGAVRITVAYRPRVPWVPARCGHLRQSRRKTCPRHPAATAADHPRVAPPPGLRSWTRRWKRAALARARLRTRRRPGTRARTAPSRTRRTRVCRSISSFIARLPRARRRNPSHANTVRRCTSVWARSRCTSGRIPCPASALRAAKRSPGRGFFKVTSGRTPARSRSDVSIATARSPTGAISGLICRLTATSRSTPVTGAVKPSAGCRCLRSIRRAVVPASRCRSPILAKISSLRDLYHGDERTFQSRSQSALKCSTNDEIMQPGIFRWTARGISSSINPFYY